MLYIAVAGACVRPVAGRKGVYIAWCWDYLIKYVEQGRRRRSVGEQATRKGGATGTGLVLQGRAGRAEREGGNRAINSLVASN